MKKKTALVSMLLVLSLTLTGCSWSDFTSKLPWNKDSAEEAADYVAEDCVTLGDYKGVEVDVTITDEELQAEIDSLIAQGTKNQKVKNRKVAKKNDIVNIDYVGKVDGKTFDGGSAEKYDLTLGSNSFIEGFEDGVIGMKIGEKKTLNLQFPDPYPSDTTKSGKKVKFTVTLNSISKEVKPKLTDKFIKKNSDYKTVDEFKKGKTEELQKEKETNKASTAFTNFLQTVKVTTYPESLIAKYKTYYDTYWKSYLKYNQMDFDTFLTQSGMTEDSYKEELNTIAKDLTRNFLVIQVIAKKEGIEITEEDKTKQIETMITNYGVEDKAALEKQIKEYYGMELDAFVTDGLYENKVMTLIGDNATIKK